MPKDVETSRIFYGWFVVAASFAVALTLGETFWSFGVFIKPMGAEFGWSRGLASSGYTAFLIGYSISAIVTGRLADRHSPRPILMTTAVLGGLGIFLCSQVQSIDQLRIFLMVTGLGAGATWSIPISTVQRWFHKRQMAGLALAIVTAGIGTGTLIFAPLTNFLILNYGWRHAYRLSAVIFLLLVGLPSLVIRETPMHTRTASSVKDTMSKRENSVYSTTKKALTSFSFITNTAILCIGAAATQVISVHLVPYAMDAGISATTAAAALGLVGGFSVLGRIMSGLIGDRMGWKRQMIFSYFALSLSVLWLLFVKDGWMLYLFAFLYGAFYGARIPAQIGIVNSFLGLRSLGVLLGIMEATAMIVSAPVPYVAGVVFDVTGSYFTIFLLISIFLLVSSLAANLLG